MIRRKTPRPLVAVAAADASAPTSQVATEMITMPPTSAMPKIHHGAFCGLPPRCTSIRSIGRADGSLTARRKCHPPVRCLGVLLAVGEGARVSLLRRALAAVGVDLIVHDDAGESASLARHFRARGPAVGSGIVGLDHIEVLALPPTNGVN